MKNKNSRKTSPLSISSGFTLVELLVVIAIVALLAVVALSVVGIVNQKAKQAVAVDTIRQVATANLTYSLENNNEINLLPATSVTDSFWGRLIPYLYEDLGSNGQEVVAADLILRLEGFFDSSDLTMMEGTFQNGVNDYEDAVGVPVPFAFNDYLNPERAENGGDSPKVSTFQDTSQIVHFCYGSGWADEVDAAVYAKLPTGSIARSSAIDWFESRGAAFVFLDGHMEVISPGVPLRRFTEDTGGEAAP